MTGSARVLHGNALDLPVEDASVDLVVTSPPYFGLRSYQDGGEHYGGQIGAEPTPAEFVDALVAATREMVRVLKPSGSIWVNLGDKYVSDNRGSAGDVKRGEAKHAPAGPAGYLGEGILPRKSLMGIPWRYALRCIDELGLILRAEVIWSKPNGLPESVTDRVRRSHEQWFHFTLNPRYYSAVDEVREEYEQNAHAAAMRRTGQRVLTKHDSDKAHGPLGRASDAGVKPGYENPLGKLPGSVWTIPTEPLRVPDYLGVDHFAAFPTEWPLRIIRGWSPAEVCSGCGEGRRPVTTVSPVIPKPFAAAQHERSPLSGGTRTQGLGYAAGERDRSITGYSCACPDTTAPSTPGVVLDPFGGTGTTALVAKALGRTGISVDLSRDYCRLADWRTNDPAQLERVRERIRAHGGETALTDSDDMGLLGLLDEDGAA